MNVQDDSGTIGRNGVSNQVNIIVASETIINCGSSIDISIVKTLYAELQEALERGQPVTLNAENIEYADGAGLQLLYAFFHDARGKGITVGWKEPSGTLTRSATLMGMAEPLQLNA